MADTKEKETKTKSKKRKVNHDPKWKTKKEEAKKIKAEAKEKEVVETKKETPKKEVKKVEKKTTAKKTTTKKVEAKTTKKVEKKAAPKKEEVKVVEEKKEKSPIKKEGKSINKQRLIDKYSIEKTMAIPKITQEQIDNYVAKQVTEKTVKEENKNKLYFGFTLRICTLVFFLLVFFTISIYSIMMSFESDGNNVTTYSEYTVSNYAICTDYDVSCITDDYQFISSGVNTIKTTFNYRGSFSNKVKMNNVYKVLGVLSVYDAEDDSKIRYTTEDVLYASGTENFKGNILEFEASSEVDFNKYKEIADERIKLIGNNSKAKLDIVLYTENSKEARKIAYITVPLDEEKFTVSTYNLDRQNQVYEVKNPNKKIDGLYAFVAFVAFVSDVLLLSYLISFIRMIFNVTNEYNTTLTNILREFDDVIVNTKSFEVTGAEKVIEVTEFKELLDARKNLNKPIVYERVNNVKSNFYVESDKTVYKFTLKDTE